MGKSIIVIGGGAAGYFAAINLVEQDPRCSVTILEKTTKLLSKVRISGGGRCNVTHNCPEISELLLNYPRGSRELRQVFARFSVAETISWFQGRGVRLKTEADGRMFPVTDDSQTIIDCLQDCARKNKVVVKTGCEALSITAVNNGFQIKIPEGTMGCDKLVCALGGHPRIGSYQLLSNFGHTIIDPIPSLFTFNLPGESIRRELQGISVPVAEVAVKGSKFTYTGPVLITHWGLSGPAVLKLSAFAAELFHKSQYTSEIAVNWANRSRDEVAQLLAQLREEKRRSLPRNTPACGLPGRLWEFFCAQAGLRPGTTWAETGKSELQALSGLLCASSYRMEGKTTFKEEFVTCGGVHLKEVDFRTMESKLVPGMYFCGEVLNMDAVTGGFNFQAAWSTAYVCATAVAAT